MVKTVLACNVFAEVGDIVRTADLVSSGLTYNDVSALCRKGYIHRIGNGFYCLADNDNIREEQLLAVFFPQGVVCLESALSHYGYSDFTPRKWSLAFPRSSTHSICQMQEVPVQGYYSKDDIHELGRIEELFNGVMLSVYDRERTICDCFKYRAKMDRELFCKAVKAYASDPKKNLMNLSSYAREMRVYSRMMEVMEVLLYDFV